MKDIDTAIEKIKAIQGMNEKYTFFIKYCNAKKNGLRKEAFKNLDIFLKEANEWSDEEKRNFIIDIFCIIETNSDGEWILSKPLKVFSVKVLHKWIEGCKTDSRPFKWLGMFMRFEIKENSCEFLKKAIELGGESEQTAIKKLLGIYINGLDYATHELPFGYLGNLEDDIKEFDEMTKILNMLKDEELKSEFNEDIKYLQDLILDWSYFLKLNLKDFESWRKSQGKTIDKIITHKL